LKENILVWCNGITIKWV